MKLPVMLLAFALVPAAQLAAQEPREPQPTTPTQEEPAAAQEAVAAAPTGDVQTHIDAGLSAFRKRRFVAARQHFEQALAADPSSAAANFYLGYTIYKIAEPKRPFHAEKQRAAELFAKAYELDPRFKPAWSKRS